MFKIWRLAVCTFSFIASSVAFAQSPANVLIDDIEIRGNRRVPRETILYAMQSKPGDVYSESLARQDLEAILALGYFDPMSARLYTADGSRGGRVLVFELREYPVIRALEYHNLKAVTESEILTRFKERRVGLGKDSPFDPVKATAARRVLREMLAEKGYPDAIVDVEVEDISVTAIIVNFEIDEGPRVRVKEIVFTTSKSPFSARQLRRAMKVIKQAGLLSSFSSKDVYAKDKLEYDLEMIRFFLGSRGYLQTKMGEPIVERVGEVDNHIPFPFLRRKGPGLRITIPIEVGRCYRITKVNESGVMLFQPGAVTLVSGLKVGEIASAATIRKGVYEEIKNIYGDRGYIQTTADLDPKYIDRTEEEGDVEFTIIVDEGKQFTLRRLEFIGNTNTRDQVLRREVALNEGDPYSKRYWDLSILRLNQLGLFEEIKEKDAINRTNEREQTVEIDVQVKERGRQSVTLNGGVSGFGGSFIGFGYSTNNLFGYGQTLSIDVSGGNRQLYASAAFTEPYFLGKPISFGLQLFAQRQQYFGNSYNTFSNFYSSFDLSKVDVDSLFTQEAVGGVISSSAPLSLFTNRFRRFANFTRFGFSYSLTASRIKDPDNNRDDDTSNDIPVTYSQQRILTSRITPSISYNTLNSSVDPTRGQSLFLGLALSGGVLGGDVNTISPNLEYKFFRPVRRVGTDKPHVFGMRFSVGHARNFGAPFSTQSLSFVGGVPITERYFLGGENDVRGYNVFSISPVARYDAFRSTRNAKAKVLNSSNDFEDVLDGSIHPSVLRAFTFEAPEGACTETPSANCNVQRLIRYDANKKEIPFYTAVGGDTKLLLNMEYRIPLTSRFALAAFFDAGSVFNLRRYQDQIVTSNYVNQIITDTGVIINSSGLIATRDELDSAQPTPGGLPSGFRQIFIEAESRTYNLLRLSERTRFLDSLRVSTGMEVRVQVPVINVPFRLIFAYNPNANPDITNPRVLGIERRTTMRFSIGRTF